MMLSIGSWSCLLQTSRQVCLCSTRAVNTDKIPNTTWADVEAVKVTTRTGPEFALFLVLFLPSLELRFLVYVQRQRCHNISTWQGRWDLNPRFPD